MGRREEISYETRRPPKDNSARKFDGLAVTREVGLEARIHQCAKLFELLPLGPDDLWQSARDAIANLKEARISVLSVSGLTLDTGNSPALVSKRFQNYANGPHYHVLHPIGLPPRLFCRSGFTEP